MKIKVSPLKHWLRSNNITQSKAAHDLGLAVSTFNNKLNGGTSWLDSDLRRINKLYGLSSDFVLGLEKPHHESEARGRGADHQENTGKSFGETRFDFTSAGVGALALSDVGGGLR